MRHLSSLGAAWSGRPARAGVLGLAVVVFTLVLHGAAPRAAGATPALAAAAAHFQSPSGNINCLLAATWADCFVRRNAWRNPPARPASCELDWFPAQISLSGRSLRVGSCRGDVGPACLAGAGLRCSTLAYGRSVAVGAIRCSSAPNGITCRRRDGRRIGFRIAREGYALYR